MEFHDERNRPAPPPPPPAMPYAVTLMLYASAGPGSAPREWPQKNHADGRRELMTEDEIGVWRRVQWLEAALLAPPTGPAPPLPYEARMFTYGGLGVVRERLAKVKPQWYAEELLSPDECAVWEYVRHLEAEVKRVTVERELSVLDSPFAPADAPGSLTRLNNSEAPTLSNPIELAAPTAVNTGADEAAEMLPHVNISAAPPIANDTDTAPANADDKRARAIAELLSDPGASNGVLAERAGCSDEFVRRLRKALEAEGRLAPVAVVTRRDGASYHITNGADSPAEQPVGDTSAAPPTAG